MESQGFGIRRMQWADLDEVLRIEADSFPDPWSKLAFYQEMENTLSHPVVAEWHTGRIVGYGIFWFVIDEAHIMNIAVHPQYRGRGIGRWLMVFMLEGIDAMGGTRTLLEVRPGNEPAKRLYKSLGFRIIGVRKRYYSDGSDALIMERRHNEAADVLVS